MASPAPSASAREALTTTVAHMFRLDENLFDFYTLVKEDGELSWCAIGAGRMLRAPTVFEDVVKTICTPNESTLRRQAGVGSAAPTPKHLRPSRVRPG